MHTYVPSPVPAPSNRTSWPRRPPAAVGSAETFATGSPVTRTMPSVDPNVGNAPPDSTWLNDTGTPLNAAPLYTDAVVVLFAKALPIKVNDRALVSTSIALVLARNVLFSTRLTCVVLFAVAMLKPSEQPPMLLSLNDT